MIFGHFFYFGHFPIEVPIEAEKIHQHGKELSYRENKICFETSEAMRTTWEHAQSDLKNFSQQESPYHRSQLLLQSTQQKTIK